MEKPYLSKPLEFADFKEYAVSLLKRCIEVLNNKNNDYSGRADSMRNFKLVESCGITEVEKGILVRMCDKFSRITNLISSGAEAKVLDEKIEDTGLDLINYTVILLAWLNFKETCLGEENGKKVVQNSKEN